MSYLFLYLVGFLLRCYKSDVIDKDFLDQHCRDSENKPVTWWYIYKPPANVVHPSGRNFSFITSDTEGRWVQSPVDITDYNMLSHTIKPTFRRNYLNRGGRAVVVFSDRSDKVSRSSARGVIMAGREGGFLLTHSVPGFPQKFKSPSLFPFDELENGHLMACVSLDLNAINKVVRAIKEIASNVTFASVPDPLASLLPGWQFGNKVLQSSRTRLRPSIYSLISVNESLFGLNGEPVEAVLLARPPGVKTCIYTAFAARQQAMFNVYGQSRSTFLTTVCNEGYGVRNLDALCLKFVLRDGDSSVYYVTNTPDYTWFAVSTAAHWQQRGAGPRQYWVCSSLVDKEDVSGEGGLLLCLQNFNLWVAFDNLKVAEPSCDSRAIGGICHKLCQIKSVQ